MSIHNFIECTYEYADPDNKVHRANVGPSGADRAQVGLMLAPWTLLSGDLLVSILVGEFCKIVDKETINSTFTGISCFIELRDKIATYRWFSARVQYLQCISNGDTAVLH